ncbi:MAG: hypothetical protein ACRDB1_14525 [Microcoleaceae cyanobacterium]
MMAVLIKDFNFSGENLMNSKYSSPVKVLTRVAVVLFVFGFFLFSNVPIALAAWGNNNLDKSVETLPNIEEKAEKATKSSPYDLNQYETKSNQGLNEIQGTSDRDKMNRSDNTLPIVNDVEKNLKNAQISAANGVDSTLDKAGNAVDSNVKKAGKAIDSLTKKVGDKADSIKSEVDKKAANATDSMKKQVGKTANDVQDKMKH